MDEERRNALGLGAGLLAAAAGGTAAEAQGPAPPASPMPGAEFALELRVLIGPPREFGQTPYGGRREIPILGGTFEGPRLKGQVLAGGSDWQLIRPDGFLTVEATYTIQADDKTLIRVCNRGVAGPTPGGRYVRTIPEFEVRQGPHQWLNEAKFVGTLERVTGGPAAVRIRAFRVS